MSGKIPRAGGAAGRREQAQQRDERGQRGAYQNRNDAITVRDCQRDQFGRFLDFEILCGRKQDLEHEDNEHKRADSFETAAPIRPQRVYTTPAKRMQISASTSAAPAASQTAPIA